MNEISSVLDYSVYPSWARSYVLPDVQSGTDRQIIKMDEVSRLLHPQQNEKEGLPGYTLWDHFLKMKAVPNCLCLAEGKQLRLMGYDAFQKHFKDDSVFLWRSAVFHHNGRRFVPYLTHYYSCGLPKPLRTLGDVWYENELVLSWRCMDQIWRPFDIAGRII